MPRNQGLHREDIKSAIRQRGQTLTGLSELWGYHRSAISQALTKPWPEVELKIAKFISLQPKQIWPKRYSPDHKRDHSISTNNTSAGARRNNQVRTAV